MAQSSSTGIKDFVKHALTSYYKNFQIKLADNAASTDTNPAIKINNGKIFVYNVGGYTGQPGHDTNDSSTIQEVINSATNNINDINSEIIDINEKIASIPGTSKMIAGNNDLTIQIGEDGSTYFYVEGYRYNKDTSSFAEGYEKNTANGNYSHAEGQNTKTSNNAEHAEGKFNQSHTGKTIHSIGIGTSDSTRKNAFEVMQDGSIYVYGLGNYNGSALTNTSTLQEVIKNAGGGQTYHAGDNIEITQDNSINALGYTYDSTNKSIIIGYNNGGTLDASGTGAHAEGYVYQGGIYAAGDGAFASGYANAGSIWANGIGAHAEGYATTGTIDASGAGAHAEGRNTHALNTAAHAEGQYTQALGLGSHAEGFHTIANNDAEHAEGKYNQSHDGKTIHSIGIGTDGEHRKNAFEVMQDGSIYVYGLNYDGSTLTNASTLQEVIKAGSGGQTYYAGNNIEITQNNSINALGYTYSGNANVSTFTINSRKSNDQYTQNLFVINSNNNNLLTFEQGVSQDTTKDTYSLNIARNFSISINTDEQSSGKTDIDNNIGDLRLLTGYGDIKLIADGGDIILDTTPSETTIRLYGETICDNNVTAAAFYQSSDARKKNVKCELDLEKCYELIDKCSEIVFEWKDKENSKEEIGMIAQEVQEFFPEIINEDEDGYLSLDYSKLTVICLRVLKDLINEVKILKNQK